MSAWIHITDGLPKQEDQVLVYVVPTDTQKEVDEEICIILTAAIDDCGIWYDFQTDEDIDQTIAEVKYWQHLPRAPKDRVE